ncbi:MAG: dihydrofolate reductase [Alphaproteobacteria bacterium]|nr:dihydrofolate reductase [Alphaproteobacteria bacterium]
MTKVAVWCRHQNDNIIGIGPHIPWHISSDFKRFRRITEGQNIVAGEKTYESFPNRTLPNRKIYVLTLNKNYEVSDKENHFVVSDINNFQEFEQDLYISGGATIYKLFMNKHEKLMPDIVVDSMYKGEINPDLKGDKIDISECIEIMSKKYFKISSDYEEDNITTTVWVKKGDFVEQSVLKRIILAIENKGAVR